MSAFLIDTESDYGHKFDPQRFMAFREGMYDGFDSLFFKRLRDLPRAGTYRIATAEKRPDVYSRDIYGNTGYWSVLLEYNGVASLGKLTTGYVLGYPSKSDLEDLLASLSRQQR